MTTFATHPTQTTRHAAAPSRTARRRCAVAGRSRRASLRSGFTLAEILVAIAAALILTVAIGQLFGSIQQLVGTSASVGELDQTARIIESRLRSDLGGFAGIEPEESAMVIRSVIIGDKNGNGTLDLGERAIYINAEDRQFDVDNGIDPYEEGSRAITARFDDLVFVSESDENGAFYTQQTAGLESTALAERFAIVSWGVGLRPEIDNDDLDVESNGEVTFDLNDEESYPIRTAIPSGVTEGDPWIDAFGARFGRNEFASTFPLTRSTLLLAGGNAYAFNDGSRSRATEKRAIAPFAFDAVNEAFTGLDDDDDDPVPFLTRNDNFGGDARYNQTDSGDDVLRPRLGLIRHGRVDITAHSLESLRRYIEGQFSPDIFEEVNDASPFDAGRLNVTNVPGFESAREQIGAAPDSPLWVREPRSVGISGDDIRERNTLGVKQALAGLVTRRLADTRVPIIRRAQGGDDGVANRAEDELLDVSGVIANGCSRFEIAWSSGDRWTGGNELRIEGPDGIVGTEDDIVFAPGELLWFDRDFTFNQYLTEVSNVRGSAISIPRTLPEFRTNIGSRRDFSSDTRFAPYTDEFVDKSGGDPDAEDEYWAFWAFRNPLTNGVFGGAWIKPELLRVRITLHDPQSRIAGGKRYEMIFNLRE